MGLSSGISGGFDLVQVLEDRVECGAGDGDHTGDRARRHSVCGDDTTQGGKAGGR